MVGVACPLEILLSLDRQIFLPDSFFHRDRRYLGKITGGSLRSSVLGREINTGEITRHV